MSTVRPRLRVPEPACLNAFEQVPALPAAWLQMRAQLRLVVPAVVGGFDSGKADALAPIRAKAVRGHLREWWRLMAWAGDFDDLVPPDEALKHNAQRLRDLEFHLWGALGTENSQGTAEAEQGKPSRVGVDVQLGGAPLFVAATALRDQCNALSLALHFACVKGVGICWRCRCPSRCGSSSMRRATIGRPRPCSAAWCAGLRWAVWAAAHHVAWVRWC